MYLIGDRQGIRLDIADGMHGVIRYEPKMDKVMRMHSVTSTIANGFVHIPAQAYWLPEYLHELAVFPNGKYDDQADSTSQALDWFRDYSTKGVYGPFEFQKKEAERNIAAQHRTTIPESMPCTGCNGVMSQRVSGRTLTRHSTRSGFLWQVTNGTDPRSLFSFKVCSLHAELSLLIP